MTELYKNIGQSVPETLEAGGGKTDSYPLEPGNGVVKHGTVMYRKSNGFYAPAAAENILTTNDLVVLVEDTDTDADEFVANPAAAYYEGTLLAKDVVLKDGTTTLSADQALVLKKQGIVLAPFADLKGESESFVNAYADITADVPAADTELLGKTADDLQTGIQIDGNAINGTLKYISDYTSAGYTGDEESGNFLALHFASKAPNATIKVELVGGIHGEKTLDEDGLCIFRVTATSQTIKVTASADGYLTGTKIYTLTGLTLNNA